MTSLQRPLPDLRRENRQPRRLRLWGWWIALLFAAFAPFAPPALAQYPDSGQSSYSESYDSSYSSSSDSSSNSDGSSYDDYLYFLGYVNDSSSSDSQSYSPSYDSYDPSPYSPSYDSSYYAYPSYDDLGDYQYLTGATSTGGSTSSYDGGYTTAYATSPDGNTTANASGDSTGSVPDDRERLYINQRYCYLLNGRPDASYIGNGLGWFEHNGNYYELSDYVAPNGYDTIQNATPATEELDEYEISYWTIDDAFLVYNAKSSGPASGNIVDYSTLLNVNGRYCYRMVGIPDANAYDGPGYFEHAGTYYELGSVPKVRK